MAIFFQKNGSFQRHENFRKKSQEKWHGSWEKWCSSGKKLIYTHATPFSGGKKRNEQKAWCRNKPERAKLFCICNHRTGEQTEQAKLTNEKGTGMKYAILQQVFRFWRMLKAHKNYCEPQNKNLCNWKQVAPFVIFSQPSISARYSVNELALVGSLALNDPEWAFSLCSKIFGDFDSGWKTSSQKPSQTGGLAPKKIGGEKIGDEKDGLGQKRSENVWQDFLWRMLGKKWRTVWKINFKWI